MQLKPVLLFYVLVMGCQLQPTVIKQEVGTQDFKNRVLVDTRSAFDFAGYHISGSINLNSGDFLILKDPRTEKRILDPDLIQVVERLAKRGVSPLKNVVLLGNKKDDLENYKWRWLLKQLDVRNVDVMGFAEYRAQNKKAVPQAAPEAVPTWEIKNPKAILNRSALCFVSWSDTDCQ